MLSILHDFVGTASEGTSSNEVTTSQFSRGKSHLRWKSPNLLLDVKRLSFLDRNYFGKSPCHVVRKAKHCNLFSESEVPTQIHPLSSRGEPTPVLRITQPLVCLPNCCFKYSEGPSASDKGSNERDDLGDSIRRAGCSLHFRKVFRFIHLAPVVSGVLYVSICNSRV